MRIKTLFSIPNGEKVTEKALRKVLISSVRSILLCMTCLVSTTWAWFAVSIENTENVIQIATIKETVTITDTENNTVIEPQNGTYTLDKGTYHITVSLVNDATGPDDLNKQKSPAYVLLSIIRKDGPEYFYFAFKDGAGERNRTLEVNDESVTLNFSVSWMGPASATLIDDDGLTVGEPPAESVATTEAAEITTAASNEIATTTVPTETMNMSPQLDTPGRASCTPSSLETEQHRRRGCTLTQPGLHGIINVSKCGKSEAVRPAAEGSLFFFTLHHSSLEFTS